MSLWIRFLIWLGVRCECGGEKVDVSEQIGWNRDRCVKCGKETKN